MFDIISIGSATFDIFLKGVSYNILRSEKFINKKGICFPLASKISVEEMEFHSGGGAINTAVSFARQGLKTSAIFNIGKNDSISKSILADLKKEGVDYSLIGLKEKFSPPISVIFSLPSAERTIFHPKRRRSLPPKTIKNLTKTRWIYIAPFLGEGANLKDKNILLSLLKNLKKNNIFIASNPSKFDLKFYKKNPKYLNFFDIFILNQEEASLLTGINYKKPKELFRKLDDLVEGMVIMTKGKNGAIASNGYWLWQVETFKEKQVVDRTGAGDAFAAGFIAGMISIQKNNKNILQRDNISTLLPIEKALILASANATSVVEFFGAHTGALKRKDLRKKRWQKLKIKITKL